MHLASSIFAFIRRGSVEDVFGAICISMYYFDASIKIELCRGIKDSFNNGIVTWLEKVSLFFEIIITSYKNISHFNVNYRKSL